MCKKQAEFLLVEREDFYAFVCRLVPVEGYNVGTLYIIAMIK